MLTVVMKNGERYTQRIGAIKGSATDRLSRDELRTKFRKLVAGRLPETRAECLLERLENVEQLADVAQICNLLGAQ